MLRWPTSVTAKAIGKRKTSAAKEKCSRQKRNCSRQKKKAPGKIKIVVAKEVTHRKRQKKCGKKSQEKYL